MIQDWSVINQGLTKIQPNLLNQSTRYRNIYPLSTNIQSKIYQNTITSPNTGWCVSIYPIDTFCEFPFVKGWKELFFLFLWYFIFFVIVFIFSIISYRYSHHHPVNRDQAKLKSENVRNLTEWWFSKWDNTRLFNKLSAHFRVTREWNKRLT
jgi:hypothetical protein